MKSTCASLIFSCPFRKLVPELAVAGRSVMEFLCACTVQARFVARKMGRKSESSQKPGGSAAWMKRTNNAR